MTEVWTKWEGQLINGVFPLRRLLSGSDRSAVFLTDYKTRNLPNAALKLVPAIPALAQAQLAQWMAAAALSHPHLIRLFEAGRCQLGGIQFLFAVMEYADQTLAQILPQRALTADEVREMLPPTLNALAFLHGNGLVQGRLKPPNILVVDDQLKLASDTIRPAGESTPIFARASPYDPPEAKSAGISAAGDIWALGITLVEALTQHPPAWPEGNFETNDVTAALPPPFAEIVRQCLNRNPAERPSVAGVEAQINPATVVPPAPPAPRTTVAAPATPAPHAPSAPLVREAAGRAIPPAVSPQRRWFAPAIVVFLLVVAAVWIGLHRLSSHTSLERAAASAAASQTPQTPPSAPPEASGLPSDQHAQPLANRSPSVLHEEIPDVPPRALNSIHGIIKIWVRVTVDGSGKVVDESVQNPRRNRYFVRLAAEAAKEWKFEPADNQTSRKWLLQFEFTRRGAAAHTVNPKS
ncbi:MAG TPA: protein kinase [Steroidobacteraceae bacterium]|nr:protein kinase [Steroidobacteraceae bacterium]